MNPAPLLYKTIQEALLLEEGSILVLRDLMLRLFVEATKTEQIKFSTAFAKACFVVQKYQLDEQQSLALHHFRKVSRHAVTKHREQQTAILGAAALAALVEALYGTKIPDDLKASFPDVLPLPFSHLPSDKYAEKLRAIALRDIPEDKCLVCRLEESPEEEILVCYGIPGHNEQFDSTIKVLRQVFGFPTSLNLLEVEKDTLGRLRPRAFVLEPDYLVDISAISECFKPDVVEPFSFLSYKFLPKESTIPILLGNVANYFLDRLMSEPERVPYREMISQLFKEQPIPLAPLSDQEARDIYQQGRIHYLTLSTMANEGFAKVGITREHSFIEPSFYSEKYGIQGRLDLFHIAEDGQMSIVELKSGKPFKPNSYKIGRSHFTQTLLYDMLVRSVFPTASEPKKYILYSKETTEPLRYAPSVVQEQREALQVRNHIISIEYLLTQIEPGSDSVGVFSRLRAAACKEQKGFTQRDFGIFEATYNQLDSLERKYFNSFVGFIAREQWLARLGEGNPDKHEGHAALWRNNVAEKEEQFSIMTQLSIVENKADAEQPYLIFEKSQDTNPLANFRVGDIVIAYQATEDLDSVLTRQLMKGVISENTSQILRIELRQRQSNLNAFKEDTFWNLEPDSFDSGFLSMYRSLFEWASAQPAQRQQLLGRTAPPLPHTTNKQTEAPQEMTEEQAGVFQQVLAAQGHFLLWGPPGTGKTSIMLRYLAEWWLRNTNDTILLLAFTNRAVDEICEALDSIGGDVRSHYLRIGSYHSTGEAFREQLLESQIKGSTHRRTITALLKAKRILVSTVSSFSGKEALLELKTFEHVVIDEASQLLEPQLVGLLTRFPKAVLIGDHQQLPAVSTQASNLSKVDDIELNSIGLQDLRDSYFERMYRHFKAKNWDYAIGSLSFQGRMHQEVMGFPNTAFYGGLLQTLPKNNRQLADFFIKNDTYFANSTLRGLQQRVLFINQQTDGGNLKTNIHEADSCADILIALKAAYQAIGREWTAQTLGIITPWRAQIAQIQSTLEARQIGLEDITIDTVERYQGGARDIILISLCVNSPYQLDAVSSMSIEGVDRKFNVALTRAREQVIVLGNEELLGQLKHFEAFISKFTLTTP